jgi:hypothetical protein
VTRWRYVAHIKCRATGHVLEISGTFSGTYIQTWTHLGNMCGQHDGTIVAHTITEYSGKGVEPEVMKAVKEKRKKGKPARVIGQIPDGCVLAEVHSYTTKEYTGNDNHSVVAHRQDPPNSVH